MPIWDQTGVTASNIIILPNGDLKITAAGVSTPINILRITAGYAGFERSVMIDRIMGRTEVVNGRGEIAYVPPAPIVPINGVCNNAIFSACSTGV
jgi:hypothetical protein